MCCCGIEGLSCFTPNTFNLEHLYNEKDAKITKAMETPGTGACFKALYQNAGSSHFISGKSLKDMMLIRLKDGSFESVCKGESKRRH